MLKFLTRHVGDYQWHGWRAVLVLDGKKLQSVGDDDAGRSCVADYDGSFLACEIELAEAEPESFDWRGLGEVDTDDLWSLAGVDGNRGAFFGSANVGVGVADFVSTGFWEDGAVAEGFVCFAVAQVAAEGLADEPSVVPAYPIVCEGDVKVVHDDAGELCWCNGLWFGTVRFEFEDLVLFGELFA